MTDPYEVLNIPSTATDEEVKKAYRDLARKYHPDNYHDNPLADLAQEKMKEINAAYEEIMRERREKARDHAGKSAFDEVAELIRAGKIAEAQEKLDSFNERTAEWHYLQSVVFYKKNWINESKKQLEIAMQLDGGNPKYRDAYEKLRARAEYREQTGGATNTNPDPATEEQMGGNWCANCASFCYTFLCVNCLFNLCCNCR